MRSISGGGMPPRHGTSGPSALILAAAWAGALLFLCSLTYFLYAYLVRFGFAARTGGFAEPAAIDIALFSAFALHHSVFARTALKREVTKVISPPLERTVYTVVASVLFIVVCAAWRPVPGTAYTLTGPVRWLGYAAQLAGLGLTVLGSRAIDVLELAGVRQVLRARSGNTAAHVRLATSGVFGLVRHPLYFGWALFVFGAPDMTFTRCTFAIVSTAYLALAIPWEERGLVETFGADYQAYRRQVRWRMIPGLY